MQEGEPLVSIRCLAYNHEPFLRQCLDGFVMQKTNFPFEAIVHDDASTDGSAAIIREYAEKYPDIIKPIYETENQYGKGVISKKMDAVMSPNSKYIALCEGDDYWTDPNKLQLQVDFLESHPDYYMTCHAYQLYYEDTKEFKPHKFLDDLPLESFNNYDYCSPTIKDFFGPIWFTQVLSIVHRNNEYVEKSRLSKYLNKYDYITCYYMLRAGKCALFKNVMGVYRKQGGGIFSGRDSFAWNEQVLNNLYILYKLEDEDRVLNRIDGLFIDVIISYLSLKQYLKAKSLFLKHLKTMPLINTIRCVKQIGEIVIKKLL